MTRENQENTANTISVLSVDEFAKRITDAGERVLTSKTAIPSVRDFAGCMDTEGNPFGIREQSERLDFLAAARMNSQCSCGRLEFSRLSRTSQQNWTRTLELESSNFRIHGHRRVILVDTIGFTSECASA